MESRRIISVGSGIMTPERGYWGGGYYAQTWNLNTTPLLWKSSVILGLTSHMKTSIFMDGRNWQPGNDCYHSSSRCLCCSYTWPWPQKWSFVMRTIPSISNFFEPLENAIRQRLIPAITGKSSNSDIDRKTFALPTCLGGLNMRKPMNIFG